jgi:threonine/homoserine/homoserine lactone efflux protein
LLPHSLHQQNSDGRAFAAGRSNSEEHRMNVATLAVVFAAGFIVMTPIGPVSAICIRRTLIYGHRAGIAAGAGDAVAVATYATIGATGSTLLPRFLAQFAAVWHIAIAVVLVAVALLIWRSQPELPSTAAQTRANLAGGFGAALALALANPADIVLFTALFAGLGIALHSPADYGLFSAAMFAGGCAYWIAVSLLLDRWRAGLTLARMVGLNRACSALMMIAAMGSLVSLARATS